MLACRGPRCGLERNQSNQRAEAPGEKFQEEIEGEGATDFTCAWMLQTLGNDKGRYHQGGRVPGRQGNPRTQPGQISVSSRNVSAPQFSDQYTDGRFIGTVEQTVKSIGPTR